jgi:hypothetical protein
VITEVRVVIRGVIIFLKSFKKLVRTEVKSWDGNGGI